jgi:hypothetical protein
MKICNILILIFYKLFVYIFLFFNDNISLLWLTYRMLISVLVCCYLYL